MAEAQTVQFPRDANGIEIRPGYRPPFNSETGRAAAIKCARDRARLVEDANIARAALRQIHAMLNKRKRGSRVVLQKSDHGKNVDEKPTVQPSSRPAPTVKPAPPISPCSIRQNENPPPVEDDDGLF